MSNEAPTDALRLVPIERIQFAIDAIAHLKPEKARFALEQMLAAAPASPLPGGGWQDISTAPALTDHMKPVLLFWKSSGVGLGYYDIDDDYRTRPKWWVSPATGWRCFGDQCIPVNQQDCTHWMPLPAAPTGDA